MDFMFAEEVERDQLLQGDLLIRDERLEGVLREAHQYYADAPSYTHFVVITQSCDLVRRAGKRPKAPYITIAAVRPFSIVLDRFLESSRHVLEGVKYPYYNASKRVDAERFLERMLNNEEKTYFFFRQGSHPSILEDMCAFLPLSVALRPTHYDALLSAKVAQLDDIFAAKLGYIVSSLYSRVATPDISEKMASPEEYKREFFNEKLGDDQNWVSSTRWNAASGEIKANFRGRFEEITQSDVGRQIKAVQDDMAFLADRFIVVAKGLGIEVADEQGLKNSLANDARLRRIAKAIA